ncbi:MAG TPA: RNA polymerase sigma-70 factor [Ktedonobacterales bacterium]|jgi:RNA polymerase sigma-70 factor (ECF subfamily)
MSPADQLDQFERQRGRLFSIAYHMLGSVADAEDVVQDAYLRYRDVPAETVRSPAAFLSTVVTRLCLNQLASARAQRDTYLGPWLPEPLVTEEDPLQSRVEAHESVSMAFLLLLERLAPIERAVFLLREVFDYPYAEIAAIVEKEEAACRQIFHRAKRFLVERRPRFGHATTHDRQLLGQFLRAVESGDMDGLIHLLAEDVTFVADGGGKVAGAATRPVLGARSVARFILGSLRLLSAPYTTELTEANGEPAIVVRVAGQPVVFISVTMRDQAITALRVIGNPEKLRHLARP